MKKFTALTGLFILLNPYVAFAQQQEQKPAQAQTASPESAALQKEPTPLSKSETSATSLESAAPKASEETKAATNAEKPKGEAAPLNAEQKSVPAKVEAALVVVDASVVPDSEIYDIVFNSNWKFSALTSFDKDNVIIPLRYLPSDILGNLTETHMVEGKEKSLRVSRSLFTQIDPEILSLKASLDETYFKSQLVTLDESKKKYGTPINALFVSYELAAPLNELQNIRGAFNFNWASKSNWRANSDFAWTDKGLVRQNTSWRKQFDDNSILIVGDTFGNTLSGVSSLNFFGARYASAYYNSGAYINTLLPTIPISGFAINPSRLDIMLNNQLVQSSDISSGRYNLNLPLQRQGFGVMQAVVYDITGKPVVVEVPFYGNNEIIRKGEHAYDVSAGMIRKDAGTKSFSYESFVFNGLYKKGIADGYTQDFFLQYSPLYSVASTVAHWVPTPKFGKLTLGIAYNSFNQQLYRIGYDRITSDISFGGNLEVSSKFCQGFEQNCIKRQLLLHTSVPFPKKYGTMSLSYASKESLDGTNNMLSLQWGKQIHRDLNLFATLSHVKNKSPHEALAANNNSGLAMYVGLSWALGKGVYSSTSITRSPSSSTNIQEALSFAEREGRPELGYGSITYSQGSEGDKSFNAYYGANLNKFAYQINATQNNNNTSLSGSVSGAIAYVPSENYISMARQMQSGLTFVKVANVTHPVPIIHENKFAGTTDSKGRFLVPDSIAMNTESVAIDINRLPKDITIEEYKREYVIPFSGAVQVDFKSKPLPYVVVIKGVKAGAIFSIEGEYYVVGEKGLTAIDSSGAAKIPLENGKVCELNFTNTQKEYDCGAQ